MNLLIQVTAINGAIIEGANWRANSPPHIREGQSIYLDLEVSDEKLISHAINAGSSEYGVEENEGIFTLTTHCRIKTIRHSLDTSQKKKKIETMVMVQPYDRMVENVFLYIYTPSLMDPKFLHLLNKT
jgi:hypothetical protein